jgi:hypothetical protein
LKKGVIPKPLSLKGRGEFACSLIRGCQELLPHFGDVQSLLPLIVGILLILSLPDTTFIYRCPSPPTINIIDHH